MLYNNVVAKCFHECVTEFRRRELDVAEEKVLSVHSIYCQPPVDLTANT
jgi:hypothetical protein